MTTLWQTWGVSAEIAMTAPMRARLVVVCRCVKLIVIGLLPYPDVRRRWAIRRRARALICAEPWPGNDATPLELTQLALARSLWLQEEVHRAVRMRQREAAALLARVAVENTLVGLWCLYAKEPMDRLRGQNARAFGSLLKPLVGNDPQRQELVNLLQRVIGGSGRLRNPGVMAQLVKEKCGAEFGTNLYHRIYSPLSTFFAHSNGIALLRHVEKDGTISVRPSYPWSRRSAARIADGSVGILAAVVASRSNEPKQIFVDYMNAHLKRVLIPLISMVLSTRSGSIRWKRLPSALHDLIDGMRYYDSVEFKDAEWSAKYERVKRSLAPILDVYVVEELSEYQDEIVDIFVRIIVGEPPTISGDSDSPDEPVTSRA